MRVVVSYVATNVIRAWLSAASPVVRHTRHLDGLKMGLIGGKGAECKFLSTSAIEMAVVRKEKS